MQASTASVAQQPHLDSSVKDSRSLGGGLTRLFLAPGWRRCPECEIAATSSSSSATAPAVPAGLSAWAPAVSDRAHDAGADAPLALERMRIASARAPSA